MNKKLVFSFLFLTGCALLILPISGFFAEQEKIIQVLKQTSLPGMLIPLGSVFLIYFIDTARLKLFLRVYKETLPFKDCFANSVTGPLFTNLTPMALGGQPAQIVQMKQSGVKSSTAYGIIFTRTAEYLVISFALLIPALPLFTMVDETLIQSGWSGSVLYIGVLVSFFLSLTFLLLFLFPDKVLYLFRFIPIQLVQKGVARAQGKMNELRTTMAGAIRKNKIIVGLDALAALLNIVLQATALYGALFFTLEKAIPFPYVFCIFVILNMVVYYVPTPGAGGSSEFLFSLVFAGISGETEQALAGVILWRFTTFYMHLVFQILFFAIYVHGKKKKPFVVVQSPESRICI